MIYCSNCGLANRDNSRFCNECGQRLGEWVDCPHCRFQNLSTARFCNQCGGQLHCGTGIPPIGVAPPRSEELPLEAKAPTVPELLALTPLLAPTPGTIAEALPPPGPTLPVASSLDAPTRSMLGKWHKDETMPAETSDSGHPLPIPQAQATSLPRDWQLDEAAPAEELDSDPSWPITDASATSLPRAWQLDDTIPVEAFDSAAGLAIADAPAPTPDTPAFDPAPDWRLDNTAPATLHSSPPLPAHTSEYQAPVKPLVDPIVPEQAEPQQGYGKAPGEAISVAEVDRLRPSAPAISGQSEGLGYGLELSRARDAALVGTVRLVEASAGQFSGAGALFGPILSSWQPAVAATKERRSEPRRPSFITAIIVAIVVVGVLGVLLFLGDLFPQVVSQR